MFDKRVLRRISGPKIDEVTGEWRKLRSFIICTHPQISLGRSNQGEWASGDVARIGERKVYKVL
jgi:hypothetical protein